MRPSGTYSACKEGGDDPALCRPCRSASLRQRGIALSSAYYHMNESPNAGQGVESAPLDVLFRAMQSDDAAEADHAWGECYRLYSTRVWSRVFYVLATIPWLKEPKEVAIDVTSEVFARLPQSISHYRESGKAEAWLMRVAVRAALREKETITGMWSKKSSRRIGVELNEETVSSIENLMETEKQDARVELSRRMEAWAADPEKSKWVRFVALFLEGYGHEEIAEQLGITVGTSRTWLWKIRRELGRASVYGDRAMTHPAIRPTKSSLSITPGCCRRRQRTRWRPI